MAYGPGQTAAALGAAVRSYRDDHGLSVEEMARHLQVRRSVVEGWERGGDFPHPSTFKNVMELLGIPEETFGTIIEPGGTTERGSFAHTMRVRRFAMGMTLRHLADVLGVYPHTTGRWELGHTIPNSANLPAVAQALNWDLDEAIRLCPASTWGGRRRTHNHEDRLRWAAEAKEEAARGSGGVRRLSERWGVTRHSVVARLRVLRRGGYIGTLLEERRRAT